MTLLASTPQNTRYGTAVRAATVLWKNLLQSGHDACDLWRLEDGWLVAGSAVFQQGDAIVHLRYEVLCDSDWKTKTGQVRGSWGKQDIEIFIVRHETGQWFFNGHAIDEVTGCDDLDLSFTPATNLIALRRLALPVGTRTEAPAAWLTPSFPPTLRPLAQALYRKSVPCYDYVSPTTGYSGLLQVHEVGFILEYPGLWTAEALHVFQK